MVVARAVSHRRRAFDALLDPLPVAQLKLNAALKSSTNCFVGSARVRLECYARADGAAGDVGFRTFAHRFFPSITETLNSGQWYV